MVVAVQQYCQVMYNLYNSQELMQLAWLMPMQQQQELQGRLMWVVAMVVLVVVVPG
jgi:hypothetical protein